MDHQSTATIYRPVAAKQIVFHKSGDDVGLYLVDAAGQLWVTENWWSDEPGWMQIELPRQ